MTSQTTGHGWRVRSIMALGLVVILANASGSAHGQPADAEALIDDIALTEVSAAQEPAAGAAVARPALNGPASLSVLDVGARLALLVIAVYAAAWVVKAAQRSGLRLVNTGAAQETGRLRDCGNLPLRGGAALHVVEVDGRPVLVATTAGGQASLLLDLTAPTSHVPEPSHEPERGALRPGYAQDADPPGATASRMDEEWQQRRDALIRSLQNARSAEA